MPKNRSLGLILVVITASVALSVWWLSGRSAGAPSAPGTGVDAVKPAAAAEYWKIAPKTKKKAQRKAKQDAGAELTNVVPMTAAA